MKISLVLKLVFLTVGLVAILYSIQRLNSQSMEKAFHALGIEPGTATSPGFQPGSRPLAEGEERLNICPTRIHAIVFEDDKKVEEFKEGLKLRWLAFDPQPREIGYMEVEKWLSQNCQIIVKPTDPKAVEAISARNEVIVRYIDRSELKVTRIGGEHFEIAGRVYQSPYLARALADLRRIAIFETPAAP